MTWKRRTFLGKTAGALVGLTAVTGSAVAQGNGNGQGNDAPELIRVGVNALDVDGGGKDLFFQNARDPANGPGGGNGAGRGNVQHLTSHGEKTGDYLTSIISLGRVDMGRFAGSNPDTLTYDYYESSTNEGAAPDEVWVYVEDENGNLRTFFHAGNDNDSNGETRGEDEWFTRQVHEVIRGNDPINPNFKWNELGAGFTDTNLLDVVGEEATLLRIGVGGADFGGNEVTSIYYDNLRLDGKRHGTFPTGGGR